MSDANSFTSLATLHLPADSRLLASACCPDKDLVVIISRLGGKDRMSLWKMQGSKKWEVDVDSGSGANEEIIDLTWSPDGQTIVLIHDPPRVTLHTIQDGHEERSIPIADRLPARIKLSAVWWFPDTSERKSDPMPDVFRRGNNIVGSAHSVLKLLPILDSVNDDSQALSASDMFAFHGLQSRVTRKPKMPDTITKWPTLPPDPLAASIEPPKRAGDLKNRPGEELDEADDSSINSILAVSDTQGFLHCFLDGSCPLGSILVSALSTTPSLSKDPQQPILFAHRSAHGHTSLLPSSIHVSLLAGRLPRDIARSSTTARELVWYVMRAVDEMRATWFGSDTQPGAKQPGQKWLQALQALQPGGTGDKAMWSLTDLTLLLISGRSTEAISDFIGSGELMSERGLQKWETTVNEALMKLRDFAEQRVAPACQRLHIIMEEVLGWSQLPQFAICALQKEDIDLCLQMTSRAIVSANWLAATARRELSRFQEFMKWLRFEIANVNPTVEPMQQPRHDILEVNSYLMSGLVDSEIDSWFFHGPPKFSPQDLGVPHEKQDLPSVINRARHALLENSSTNLSHTVIRRNLGTVARNMDTLIQILAKRTEQIFALACEATARSARVSHNTGSMNGRPIPTAGSSSPDHTFIIRERTIVDKDETSHFIQHLAIRARSAEGRTCLCLIRLRYNREACSSPAYLGSAIIECRLAQDGGLFADFDLLDVDFFDDENLVVVFRTRDVPGRTFIATVSYSNLLYQELERVAYVNVPSREALMADAMRRWNEGQLASVLMPIKRSRALAACGAGEVSLAVNGRAGRRVACVLDSERLVLETLDLEGDEAEESDSGEEAETTL